MTQLERVQCDALSKVRASFVDRRFFVLLASFRPADDLPVSVASELARLVHKYRRQIGAKTHRSICPDCMVRHGPPQPPATTLDLHRLLLPIVKQPDAPLSRYWVLADYLQQIGDENGEDLADILHRRQNGLAPAMYASAPPRSWVRRKLSKHWREAVGLAHQPPEGQGFLFQ